MLLQRNGFSLID